MAFKNGEVQLGVLKTAIRNRDDDKISNTQRIGQGDFEGKSINFSDEQNLDILLC